MNGAHKAPSQSRAALEVHRLRQPRSKGTPQRRPLVAVLHRLHGEDAAGHHELESQKVFRAGRTSVLD